MRAVIILSMLGVLALWACGGGSGALSCPPGYQPSVSGRSCVPVLRDAGLPPDAGPTDLATSDSPDLPATPDGAARDGGEEIVADLGPAIDIPTPTGAIGDPCRAPRDCQDGMDCLGWPDGYCTFIDCDLEANDCPEGAQCLILYGETTACFRACEDSYDCRWWTGQYTCKTVVGAPAPPSYPDGTPARVCVGLDESPAGNGARCASHSGCEGELACVPSLPGGSCLQLFCQGPIDCVAPGSACVAWNGLPTCMQTCDDDPDCAASGDGSMLCTELKTLAQNDVDVCASPTSGLGVGQGCLSDFECLSGECQVLGNGYCQLNPDGANLPCFSQADCPTGFGSCLPTSPPIGICSSSCELVGVCPGGGGCVREGSEEAMCRPACEWSQSHAFHDCQVLAGGLQTGWDCVYGIPHRNEDLDGYYCATVRRGEVGSTCAQVADCDYASPICWKWPGAPAELPGYCSRSCGPTNPCPFGTYCFETSGGARCLKLCASALDCAEGYACGATSEIPQTTAGKDICLLP